MSLQHATTKIPGEKVFAVADWNVNHIGTLDHGTELTNVTADQHHAEIHTILSHDTDTTGAELTSLGDNSMADTLHRHSELSASDGTPDANLILDATGQVGIGTATPLAKLDIGGLFTPVGAPNAELLVSESVDERTGIELRNTSTSGTAADARIAVSDNSGHYLAFSQPAIQNTQGALFGLARGTTDFLFNAGGTARDMAIGTAANNALVFGQNLTEVMRLHTNSNVGIGTTLPTSKLHVVGLPIYATNALAIAGGLTAGAFYRLGADPDHVCVVH